MLNLGTLAEGGNVVTVGADVKDAERNLRPAEAAHVVRERAGERGAAGVNADNHQVLKGSVALDDLVGDPGQRPPHVVGGHDRLPRHKSNLLPAGKRLLCATMHFPCRPHRTRLKASELYHYRGIRCKPSRANW